jgi:DNA-binding NarL/FixJ family response regulator
VTGSPLLYAGDRHHGEPPRQGPLGKPASAAAISVRPHAIRVALVEDHHLVREGLRLALAGADGFEIVGEAATRAGAVDLVAATRPDVLLLDLTLPEGDALPLLESLPALQPGLRIIILTMHSDPETVRQALAAGASGYLVKGAHLEELFAAIRAVARGQRYLHSSVTEAVVEDSIRWLRSGPLSERSCGWLPPVTRRPRSAACSGSACTPSDDTSPTSPKSLTCMATTR